MYARRQKPVKPPAVQGLSALDSAISLGSAPRSTAPRSHPVSTWQPPRLSSWMPLSAVTQPLPTSIHFSAAWSEDSLLVK